MAIEKLKNNSNVLDMTAPPVEEESSTPKRPKPRKETVIDMSPKSTNRMKVTTSGGSREKISIEALKGKEEEEQHGNPHISPVQKEADNLLDLTNPDSMFNQYFNEKVEEYNTRMAEEEERVRDAVESGELERDGEIARSWLGDPEEDDKINTVRTADIDFDDEEEDDIVDEEIEEEEEEVMPENKRYDNVDELDIPEDLKQDFVEDEEAEELDDGIDKFDFEEPEAEEEAVTERDPVMSSLIADIIEDEIEDNEEEYEDNDVDLSEDDEYEDEEEEEEEPIKTKIVDAINDEEKKKTSSKLRGIDLAISSKKTDLKDDDEEEDDTTNPQDDELVNKLRRMATERLRPKKAAIDISNFVIGKASVKNINPVISIKENKIAKWVLINQEQVVLMREFSGADLQTFVETANANTASGFSRRMRLIYNHIESPKPSTFESWLKSTPYMDIDHYYFGVYVASFNGANFMPIDCAGGTKCPEGTFVSDDVPIMDLVKFTNDKVKSKFKKIYKEETTLNNPEGKFVYNAVPINNHFAIGFKEPMLYDFIETLSVDETFSRKYGSVVDLVPYIDNFYVINTNTGTLDPVGYNEFPGNASKTFRSRIRKYNTILSYLDSDEYAMIEAYAKDIRDNDDGIKYITPSLTCPYCGTESEEIEMTAESLVFTRYQLGALVNTTLR